MTHLLPVLIIVLPLIAGEDKPAGPSIRGKWEVTAVTFNGTTFAHRNGRILDFESEGISTVVDDLILPVATYTVGAAASPKRIDLNQDDAGKKALGVYSIEKDELRLCYGEPGAERPVKFESKPGARVFLVVLKRVKD
jgi:uncharacterized protein (TIGR03067 family)